MNSSIEAEIFIRKKIPIFYKMITILTIILVVSVLIILNMNYQTMIKTDAIIKKEDSQYLIMLSIKEEEVKYIVNNNYIKLDNTTYYYKIYKIEEDLYLSQNLENYKIVYLKSKLNKEYKINNLTLTAKINKNNKKIINYIIDYFMER